ncbi:hypothetical protein [Peloplasma aerotolerans]|uniref:Uncharacterized protein n=1 Tax=Peloplasma aerotolerans TaxID=3044389 RepID=A0AAW6UAZ0_9MOLU|nr:hypothetical protein [Mariniplasma sp. M4Ah]MDI6453296.1 hypothetical protein [Mariniplasma sp. M4Ah]MDR4968463.1 hypothetical protein [Acholeplasmataceae bacterium]
MRFAQIGIQLLIVSSYFFNIMNYDDQGTKITITGFEAIITNEYFIFGNIFLAIVLLSSLYHLITQVIALFNKPLYDKLDQSLTIAVNIQLFIGLFVVTFIGLYLEMLGLAMVGLVVLGAFIKYKFKL